MTEIGPNRTGTSPGNANLIPAALILSAIVEALAGMDILFTRMVFKNAPALAGYALLAASILDLPVIWFFYQKKSRAAPGAYALQESLREFQPDLSKIDRAMMEAGQETGAISFYYAQLNQVVGMVFFALVAAVGVELVFLHKFIPPQPGKVITAGWVAMVIGGLLSLSGLKGLLLPKPVLTVSAQGISFTGMFLGSLKLIPWSAVRKIELTSLSGQRGAGATPALGVLLDESFKLPALMDLANADGGNWAKVPINTLNAKPEAIVEQVRTAWQQYRPAETHELINP